MNKKLKSKPIKRVYFLFDKILKVFYTQTKKERTIQMEVKQSGPLLEQLYVLYQDYSKKKVKNYLKSGCVYVNHQPITQYDFVVSKGSQIEIHKENKTHKHSALPILFENQDFLVIDKPSGLLSIGTEKEKEKTAYHLMRQFLTERGRGEKLFILHRLDRETSGVLVFVKNERLKRLLQENWNQLVKERSYVAVVEGIAKEQETLRFSLKEGKDYKMYVVPNGKGQLAVTHYRCIQTHQGKSLLSISLDTGRKNQIRASLAHIGLTIVGDSKYGASKKASRLYLHANKLVLIHPITKQKFQFESKVPKDFKTILK